MSEGEKTSSIRLPAEQEEFVKLMNEKYGFTRNNLIKMALLQFQKEYYPLLRNDIILPSEMTSNRDKGDIAKCNHSARRNDSKPSTPSRAP
jgi:predicted DNA-binding protein